MILQFIGLFICYVLLDLLTIRQLFFIMRLWFAIIHSFKSLLIPKIGAKLMNMFTKSVIAAFVLSLSSQNYAAPTKPVNVSPAEKAKIESVVHEYLVKNPEVIIEVMQILQRKQYEQAQQAVQQTQKIATSFAKPLFHQANDPMIGNPNGQITLVEFFDYQCPHCVEMGPILTETVKANPNLRVIFKEFPIRGPISDFAARAALAANKQGKYQQFSHALLNANPPLSQDAVLKIAKDSGLDVEKLKKDMNDKSIKDQIAFNTKLAKDLKLMGTPAIFIGKTNSQGSDTISYIPGRADKDQLQETLKNFN